MEGRGKGGGDLGTEGRTEGGDVLMGRSDRGMGEDIGQPGET